MARNSAAANVPRGAMVHPFYVERDVKIVGVLENELDTVAYLNTQTTGFISAGSFLSALAFGIWTNAAFVAEKVLTPKGEILSFFVAPGLLGLALVCGLFAYFARRKRNETWERIKSESRPIARPST